MKLSITILIVILGLHQISAKTIRVHPTLNVPSLQSAASVVEPGDTILLLDGNHLTGQFISNFKGTGSNPIWIISENSGKAIFDGGSTAFQLSDAENLIFEGITFKGQTANGVNCDDGGTYETPSKNITFYNCYWESMNATGNNDELKLSGIDSLAIVNCSFKNGSAGGSMIDMVGCHFVSIKESYFYNSGSNSIQAKGGCSDVTISRNKFINGGQRAINIGGSTGLQFFRPLDAKYESKSITVLSNIFVGSDAPIAFVGTIESKVFNNTLINPNRWAVRILQENTSEGFATCSNNEFINNIVVFNNNLREGGTNIGGNTLPATFIYSNNLWFNSDNPNWNSLNNNLTHINTILAKINPIKIEDYHLQVKSEAIGRGLDRSGYLDFYGKQFLKPTSIGAVEYDTVYVSVSEKENLSYLIYPNPALNYLDLEVPNFEPLQKIAIFDNFGRIVITVEQSSSTVQRIEVSSLPPGLYFIQIGEGIRKFIKL
jgi:hypothetical protein